MRTFVATIAMHNQLTWSEFEQPLPRSVSMPTARERFSFVCQEVQMCQDECQSCVLRFVSFELGQVSLVVLGVVAAMGPPFVAPSRRLRCKTTVRPASLKSRVDNFMGTSAIPMHDHRVSVRETRHMIRIWLSNPRSSAMMLLQSGSFVSNVRSHFEPQVDSSVTLVHGDLKIGFGRLLQSENRIFVAAHQTSFMIAQTSVMLSCQLLVRAVSVAVNGAAISWSAISVVRAARAIAGARSAWSATSSSFPGADCLDGGARSARLCPEQGCAPRLLGAPRRRAEPVRRGDHLAVCVAFRNFNGAQLEASTLACAPGTASNTWSRASGVWGAHWTSSQLIPCSAHL